MTGIEAISLLKANLRKKGELQAFYDDHANSFAYLSEISDDKDERVEICLYGALALTLELDRILGADNWYQ
jgi:hypothetical protein